MNTKKLIVAILIGVGVALLIGFLMHLVRVQSHAFAIIPIGLGFVAGFWYYKRQSAASSAKARTSKSKAS
jgi:F0F1-type ATP synthase assembly protein I